MGLTLTDAKRQILRKLWEEPRHGYALASELGKQGPTIYEHLQQLEDAGYIKAKEEGRRKVYFLAERGELTIKAEEIDKD